MSSSSETMAAVMSNATALQNSAASAISAAIATIIPPEPFTPEPYSYNGWQGYMTGIGDVPQYQGTQYTPPSPPSGGPPNTEDIPHEEYGEPPTSNAINPGIELPSTPAELDSFLSVVGPPPSIGDITVPVTPSALNSIDFTPPTLSAIVVPPAPSVVLPEFSATSPDTDIAPPTDFADDFAANYANMSVSMRNTLNNALDAELSKLNPEYHSQIARLEGKLTTYIDGGTALTPEVEQAIYNRGRDRVNAEYEKTRASIVAEGASLGFTIPGGAQYSALARARQAAADNNSRAAMEIAIKQAEMEQANIQFALTQSQNLRGVILSSVMAWLGNMAQINGQSLEYARNVMQAAVSLYETMVRIVTARIEVYKAEAQVYEVRLKAVLAVYDLYQAQIKALEAQVNVDRAKVDAFSAQMGAYGHLANAYQASIQGAMAQAQMEKIKVDIYEAMVRSYGAMVSAKQAEWQGYTAGVQGETAKVSAYETEVRAYGQEVQAYSVKVQAYKAKVEAVSAKNQAALGAYEASVRAYTATVQGESENSKAQVQSFESTISAWKAGMEAQGIADRVNLESILGEQRLAQSQYDMNTRVAIAAASTYSDYTFNVAKTVISASSILGNMAGSAMAGVTALGADIDTKSS